MTARTIAWLCVLSLLSGTEALAHEIGTSRVSVVFHHGTYEIDVVTDAAALAEKLTTVAGGEVVDVVDAPPSQSRLEALDAVFRRRVQVTFDGVDVRPDIAHAVVATPPDGGPTATIRLTGTIPPGARQFTWTYSWTFASYALSIRGDAEAPASTEWLEGGQRSTHFELTAPPPPPGRWHIAWRYLALGFTHIVPYGLDHVLFVLGIYLLSRRARSVLWQVSAFTAAHSITLGLSLYGVVALPPRIVEPLIALSSHMSQSRTCSSASSSRGASRSSLRSASSTGWGLRACCRSSACLATSF